MNLIFRSCSLRNFLSWNFTKLKFLQKRMQHQVFGAKIDRYRFIKIVGGTKPASQDVLGFSNCFQTIKKFRSSGCSYLIQLPSYGVRFHSTMPKSLKPQYTTVVPGPLHFSRLSVKPNEEKQSIRMFMVFSTSSRLPPKIRMSSCWCLMKTACRVDLCRSD